jgi:sugar (pentulose or hexulose) kinase
VENAAIEAVCTPPPILHVVEPDSARSDLYAHKIGRYRTLYRNLKELFVEKPN